jgi:F0F1-type ATP synthase alpha subunit
MVKVKSKPSDTQLVEAMAPGIISRKSVCEPLQTELHQLML